LAESSTANATPAPQQVPRAKDMSDRSKKLIDDQQFVDKVSEFLSENPDFLVVGIVGPQSCGKSTIMNALAKDLIELKSSNDENNGGTSNGVEQNNSNFFRVQSFEKQMTGEHCTNGVYLWISPKHRIILIDSQPVNSPSFLDRTIQVSLG
jgi:nicotinamide riboside kinase